VSFFGSQCRRLGIESHNGQLKSVEGASTQSAVIIAISWSVTANTCMHNGDKLQCISNSQSRIRDANWWALC